MTRPIVSDPQKRLVLTFSLATFLFHVSAWMVAVHLPLYLEKDAGLPRAQIGLLISIYAFALVVLIPVIGHFSDRASPKKIIQFGLFLFACYSILLAQARTFSVLASAQVLGGGGESLVVVALGSLYYKHLTSSRRGKKVGVYIFAVFFGFALGPLLSGFLLKRCGLSYRAVFSIVGGLAAGLLLFSGVLEDSAPFRIRLFEYKQDIFRKEVFLLVCMLVGMGIHYGNERASFSLYMKNVVRLDDFDIGSVFAVLGLWIAVMSVVTGTIYDWNKKVLLFIGLGLVVSGFFHIWTAFMRSYFSVLLARILHTTGDSVVIFSANALIASIFPVRRMGGNFGFTSFFSTQGAFLGALVSGLLDAHCGYRVSFISAGCCTILLGLIVAAHWKTILNLSLRLSK